MLWHSGTELENEGPPGRGEMLWAVAAAPLLIFQIVGWSLRILAGLSGEPLLLSDWFDIDAVGSDSFWIFAAGVGMYGLFIAFALLLLWACSLQFQRWAYWRGRARTSA